MKSKGNGNPEVCVFNLLRTVRGEVPYERLKGISSALIDQPSSIAKGELEADAQWVLKTYEPRVSTSNANMNKYMEMLGDYELTVEIQQETDDERDD